MRKYTYVLEEEYIVSYLQKRQLLKQYKHAKEKLIAWIVWWLDFKERQPQWSGVFSFRINKQYRAIWYERDWVFVVTEIDNHQ
jgi:plasmid maintenance system killer protein